MTHYIIFSNRAYIAVFVSLKQNCQLTQLRKLIGKYQLKCKRYCAWNILERCPRDCD